MSRTALTKLAPRLTRQRASPQLLARLPIASATQPIHIPIPTRPQPTHLSRHTPPTQRHLSTTPRLSKDSTPKAEPPADIKAYDFGSLSSLVAQADGSRITIIDVREPGELQQSGRVPGAQNVPINSAPDGLFLPAEEFEDRFGFEKPAADAELVFYCKAGVRSRAAARVARMAGWVKVGEYPGSWVDWERNGGEVQR